MNKSVKALLIVKGNVQGVGYRAYVKQAAKMFKIKGFAKNLENGEVEIYCQASSQKIFDLFLKNINSKGDKKNLFSLNVESIKIFLENNKKFNPPKNAFQWFWIDFDNELSRGEKEMIEKTEIGGLILQGMNGNIVRMDKNIVKMDKNIVKMDKNIVKMDKNIVEIDKNIQSMGGTLVEFKDQTVGNFSNLDNKYGTVSDSLDKINKNLGTLNNTLDKISKKILN